jgi:hypothetical protein
METETEQYKQRTRAEREELKARIAILTNRVVELTQEKASDLCGSVSAHADVSYEIAASHADSKLTEQDHKIVQIQLSRAWANKMGRFAL